MPNTVLWNKNFTLIVLGQIISLFGNTILRFSLSLFVLDQTDSATVFGGILALSMVPTILLSPFGGILADRFNRRNIMVFLDFITGLLIALFAFTLSSSALIPLITGMMMILSILQSFYQPAVQSSIPLVTSSTNLMKANGIVVQISALANLLGPILGGMLYSLLGLLPIVLMSSICLFLSALMELFIVIPFTASPKQKGLLKMVLADFKEGFVFILKEKPIILKCLGIMALLNLFLSSLLMVGMPYLVTITLGLSSTYYGLTQGAFAIGSILGGVSIGFFAKKVNLKHAYLFLLLASLCLIPMGLILTMPYAILLTYIVITFSALFGMFFATLFNIFIQTFLQQATPPHLLGKMSAYVTTIVLCSFPIGQSLYGFLFDTFSSHLSFVVLGTAFISGIISLSAKSMFKHLTI